MALSSTMAFTAPSVLRFIMNAAFGEFRYALSRSAYRFAKSTEPMLLAPVSLPSVFALEPTAVTGGTPMLLTAVSKPKG
jgi:hypothetical protein